MPAASLFASLSRRTEATNSALATAPGRSPLRPLTGQGQRALDRFHFVRREISNESFPCAPASCVKALSTIEGPPDRSGRLLVLRQSSHPIRPILGATGRVSYPIARLLDGANVMVVDRRIRGRQSATSSQALERYLQELPADPLSGSLELRPRRCSKRWGAESWEAEAGGWLATRLPARGTPRGAVILLHGWLAARPQVAFTAGLATPLRRAGIEVWVPRLPAHCERTPPGTISGERCLSADLVATGESLRQAVAETRALAVWLRRRVDTVGMWGVSLGGWIAALTLTTVTSIDAAVLWTPVVDPHDTMCKSPLTSAIRGALVDAGVDRDLTVEVFRHYAAGRRRLQLVPDNVIVIGAQYDNVVSPASLLDLGRRWGVSVRWFPHGHISVTCAPGARRYARQALLSTMGLA